MIAVEKLIQDIEENDIGNFASKYSEDKFFDFKRGSPLGIEGKKNDNEVKNEFVRDVISFANTAGGYLIYGINESRRIPTEFVPFHIDNIETLENALGQIIRKRSDPVVNGVKFYPIKKGNGQYILIISIPRSFNSPHALIDPNKGYPIYFGRSLEGTKYPYNTLQIRNSIISQQNVNDRMKLYRENKVNKIIYGEAPLILTNEAKIIMHLFPLSSFDSNEVYNIEGYYNDYQDLSPLDENVSLTRRRNAEGILIYDYPKRGCHHSYVQLQRNGIIESVDATVLEQTHHYPDLKLIDGQYYEKQLISALIRYSRVLKAIGIHSSVYCGITLTGVKEFFMRDSRRYSPISSGKSIDRDMLLLPEIEISDIKYNLDTQAAAGILRPIFDIIWNACDYKCSSNFDENGTWKLERI